MATKKTSKKAPVKAAEKKPAAAKTETKTNLFFGASDGRKISFNG